jgi:hypothetical protein
MTETDAQTIDLIDASGRTALSIDWQSGALSGDPLLVELATTVAESDTVLAPAFGGAPLAPEAPRFLRLVAAACAVIGGTAQAVIEAECDPQSEGPPAGYPWAA